MAGDFGQVLKLFRVERFSWHPRMVRSAPPARMRPVGKSVKDKNMPSRPSLEYDSSEIDGSERPRGWRFVLIAVVIGGIVWYIVAH